MLDNGPNIEGVLVILISSNFRSDLVPTWFQLGSDLIQVQIWVPTRVPNKARSLCEFGLHSGSDLGSDLVKVPTWVLIWFIEDKKEGIIQ